MRKTLLFVTAAALVTALASCSQDETTAINQGDGISFRASLGKATRATETTLNSMGSFNVTAVKANKNIYFQDVLVQGSGSAWATKYPCYWLGENDEIEFLAYSPVELKDKIAITDGDATRTINDFTPNNSIADQKDVVISYNTGSKAANESSGVAMNFKHILSQIEVKAQCANPNMDIRVIGVKIGHIPSTAAFTFPNVATTSNYSLAANCWTSPATNVTYKESVAETEAITLNDSPQSIMFDAGNAMLIPQQLVKWGGNGADKDYTDGGAYLSVLCRISVKGGSDLTQLYPSTAGAFGYSAVPIGTKWEPGKKYTYTLDFCGTNSGGGQVDPEDPDGGNPGDPILSNPIKFNVTVDDWTTDAPDVPVEMEGN